MVSTSKDQGSPVILKGSTREGFDESSRPLIPSVLMSLPVQYFYFDSVTQEGVESNATIDGQEADILNRWQTLSPQLGSFLGVYCEDGQIMQFMWEENYIQLDLPDADRGGSLQKPVTRDEASELLTQALQGANPREIPGLEFFQW